MRIRWTSVAAADIEHISYIAVYRAKGQSIEVLRVYHSAQDRPDVPAVPALKNSVTFGHTKWLFQRRPDQRIT
jgi:hypothetical protein